MSRMILIYVAVAGIAIGRIFITPRLMHIPSIEGSYESMAHIVDGFLIIVPFYDWKQQLGPSKLLGVLGWALAFWELVGFLCRNSEASMTTVTWLLALHLTFTYVPKIIDAVQGIQQIEINRQNQKLDQWMIQQAIQNQKVGPSRPTSLHPKHIAK